MNTITAPRTMSTDATRLEIVVIGDTLKAFRPQCSDRTNVSPNSDMTKVGVGIVGSRFQADCIVTSVKALPEEAEVVAVASPTAGNAEAFAKRHGVAGCYTD